MSGKDLWYQDLRGSMSRFEAIRPEDVDAVSEGMLDYDWVAELLAEYGLSIDKVVFDTGRPIVNTFYADYEQGLYCEIYLQLRNFEEGQRPLFQELARKRKEGNQHLRARDWSGFYTVDVPLPMQAYDFQRRMYDMEPDKVFGIWLNIYKRLDYSNGVWRPETIEYIFSHAPATEKPVPDDNGLITIYRGMGELSQAPEEAISWSTDPGNALWFANHSGRGSHMVAAEVYAEDIVAYYPGFYYENEVLVRPHTVKHIRSADMLPANEETFIRLTAPMLQEFQTLGRQALRFGYPEGDQNIFSVHGVHHILRVLFLSLLYFYNSGDPLTPADKLVLIYFSILHDVARTHENEDETHGDAAVEDIHRKGLRIKGVQLCKKGYRIAELMIRYHCRDDADGIAAIQAMEGLSRREKERAALLYRVCKDMDGLDRVRFNGLDYRMLRTPFAARLPLIAGCLLKEDILEFVRQQSRT